mgnify:CR=1 FL=1
MFKDLNNFSLVRTGWSIVGFYLAWFLFLLLLGAVIGGFMGIVLSSPDSASIIIQAGAVLSAIVATSLTVLIAQAKGMMKGFWTLSLIVLTFGLALLGGGLLGLIIPTYLSSRASQVVSLPETV